MQRRDARGNALPETVLVLGLFFLLMFGSLNLAFLGYNQMRADGATYIAARAAAANPSTAPSAAASAVAAVFPDVSASAVAVTQVGSLVQATYAWTSPGLILLGDKGTGNFNVFSREVETTFGSNASLGSAVGSQYPYTVGSSGLVPLNNYGSTHNVWLAQTITVISSGCNSGNIGASSSKIGTSTTSCYSAAEFSAHCEAYANLKFTNTDKTIPTTYSTKNAREVELTSHTADWNPSVSKSNNSVIYGWDSSPHSYATPTYTATAIVSGGTGMAGKC